MSFVRRVNLVLIRLAERGNLQLDERGEEGIG